MSRQRGKPRMLVIGGMNMDFLGTAGGAFVAGDSLPGTISLRPGGVGRNIAQTLAALHAEVELVCALGADRTADILKASCEKLGIGLQHALQTNLPSPSYMAIHGIDGDMAAAINDMRAMDALTGEALAAALNGLTGFDACVLDANLAEDALSTAAQTLRLPLIADPVSAAKCRRFLPVMNRLKAIKPNLMEALALSGKQEMHEAARQLLKMGVEQVYISLGKDGLYYADRETSGILPASPLPPVSLTGAGDAMTAGLALAIAKGLPIKEAAQAGMDAARDFLLRLIANEHNCEEIT